MRKKKTDGKQARVNPELEGLEIKINELGEIITNYDINKINEFLNRNVKDKKLIEREHTLKKLNKKQKKANAKRKKT